MAKIADSTFEITDNSAPTDHTSIAGDIELISLLKAKGDSWKTYQESMPSPCYKFSSEDHTAMHDPFVYFSDVTAISAY
jgi:hypothetical protein